MLKEQFIVAFKKYAAQEKKAKQDYEKKFNEYNIAHRNFKSIHGTMQELWDDTSYHVRSGLITEEEREELGGLMCCVH